ncbi:MAG: TonB family protein [Candidatus Acidiferrales bacterium]
MPEAMEFVPGAGPPNERRRHARQSVRSLIYAELDRENGGIVLDASEGGMSVHAVVGLTEDVLPRMRLKLPETNEWLETRARVVWKQDSGKVAGLQFEELPDVERDRIREWLSREGGGAELEAASDLAPAEQRPAEKSKPENGNARLDADTLLEVGAPASVPANTVASASQIDKSDHAGEGLSNSIAGPAESASRGQLPALVHPTASTETNTRAMDESAKRAAPPPETMPGPELARPSFLRVEPGKPIYLLLLVLAVVSVTSGWAAGRGKFRPVVEQFQKLLARNNAEDPIASLRSERPPAPVKEIEIVSADNQNWTISLLGAPIRPAPAIPQTRPAVSAAQSNATPGMNFQVWTLSPPRRSIAASDASAAQKAAPPAVDDSKAGQGVAPSESSLEPTEPVVLPVPENMTGVLKRGALIHRVEPEYPEIAKQQGISGTVILEATIGMDGAVSAVRVISGPKLLIRAAQNAVRQWRYAPTLLDGKAIETTVQISLVFHLPNGSF